MTIQTPLPYKLGRNDRRILARVCATNGGGYDLFYEPSAPSKRLRDAGLIARKKHPHGGNTWWVHTPLGLQVHRALTAAPAGPAP